MTKVNFIGIECEINKRVYPHNKSQFSLDLFVADTSANSDAGHFHGEPVLTASVCIPGYPFKSGETAIKDYSENEGILDILVQAKIIELTGKSVNSGYCTLPIVRIVI